MSDILARRLAAALSAPETLDQQAVRELERLLDSEPLAVTLIPALIYGRPDLVPSGLADRLRPYAHLQPGLVNAALRALLFTAEAPAAVRVAMESPQQFCDFLREATEWKPELVAPQPIAKRNAGELAAARVLRDPSFRLLAVVNSSFGQGDEMVRTVPLLQALLDANPRAAITLVSRRAYLFDHPRIQHASLSNDAEVERALARDYDGVAHFHEPAAPHFNCRRLLPAAVSACINRCGPRLVLEGGHADHTFTFQRVQLEGTELAPALALDRPLYDNIYDPTLRLLAAFGLPMRLGQDQPSTPSVLTAMPSADAERLWRRLTGAGARKVALVNPFGGSSPEKGYMPEHFDQLDVELRALVEEGFQLVLLPNGTPWGAASIARKIRDRLPEDVRRHVSIAPDPADGEPSLSERPECNPADRVMRLFKYLTARADLVVTVEGWLSHLAYNLGRPFRLVLMAHSPSHPWYPPARGPDQRLVTTMSPLADLGCPQSDLLDGRAGAPFPRLHRKRMLESILPYAGTAIAVHTLGSPDYQLRRQAAGCLRGNARAHKTQLLRMLGDREASVRAEAASVLMEEAVNCEPELGHRWRDKLSAHIAVARQDWNTAIDIGSPALPALAAAAGDRSGMVRYEAVCAAARILWPGLAWTTITSGGALPAFRRLAARVVLALQRVT